MPKKYYLQLKQLLKKAHAPLTGVKVAAIIVTDKGEFKGVNIESAVCSLSICAERNALFNAITNGAKEVKEIHITSNIEGINMCGACRQLFVCWTKPTTKVYSYSLKTGKATIDTLGQLLPKAHKLEKKIIGE